MSNLFLNPFIIGYLIFFFEIDIPNELMYNIHTHFYEQRTIPNTKYI